jgi:hypothetical protein
MFHPATAPLLVLLITAPAAAQTTLLTKYGGNADAEMGTAVAGGADFNKDGFDDVVIGIPFADANGKTDNGVVRVFSGLDGSVLFTRIGLNDDDHFGFSVDVAGDVDGDTWQDLIVGSPNAKYIFNRPGMTHVYSLKTGLTLAAWVGDADGDEFGRSVAGGFDAQNDGHADLVVGAPSGNPIAGGPSGYVRTFSGIDDSVINTHVGTHPGGDLGRSVAVCGDVNNSGSVDYVAGSPGAFAGSGMIEVWDGATGTTIWTRNGSQVLEAFGTSVAGGLDANGNGYDDVVVGAPFNSVGGSNSGAVLMFDGLTGLSTGFFVTGSTLDNFGQAVGVMDDVDGDGIPDVIAGSNKNYVSVIGSDTEVVQFTAFGDDPGDGFGRAVARAGDLNGDGTPDLVVGAPFDANQGGATRAGMARVISGGSDFQSYCTAGVSASGCQATISASGAPSATATSGFVLSAVNVEGNKDGLFFYGANGRQANSWGNGTSFQCVVPPVKRGGLLGASGTAGACDGGPSQDLNARWCPACPKPNHNFGAGATVQAQLWYRDPTNTSNQTTSLSDAIEFQMLP